MDSTKFDTLVSDSTTADELATKIREEAEALKAAASGGGEPTTTPEEVDSALAALEDLKVALEALKA